MIWTCKYLRWIFSPTGNTSSRPIFLIKARLILIHRVFYPKVYFRVLLFALCFILFLSKDSEATDEDKDVVQKQVEIIFQISSNTPTSDEHRPAAKNIAALRNAITRDQKL